MGTVDVVIPAFGGVELTLACVDSVLRHSGPSLGRVIVVHDAGPEDGLLVALQQLRAQEERVRLLENEANLGFVRSANRGLALRQGHAVVMNNDTRATPGWLDELLAVLADESRIAAVSPLSNNATLCSVPEYQGSVAPEQLDVTRLPLRRLPRWTAMPTLVGFCMLMRSEALDLIGGFDPAFGRGYNEENDWCQRAQQQGFLVARANRAFVFHQGGAAFGASRAALDLHNARRLVARYPTYLEQNRAFDAGPQAQVAARGVRAATGPLRVRRLGDTPEAAVIRALNAIAGVEVTTQTPTEREPFAAVPDVLHVVQPESLEVPASRLVDSGARLVVTAPDLGALMTPTLEDAWEGVERRRSQVWALAQAADALIVESDGAKGDVVRWLGVPGQRVHAVAPALDTAPSGDKTPGLLVTWVPARGARHLELVLSAFRLLRQGDPELELSVLTDAAPFTEQLPAGARLEATTAAGRRGRIGQASCLMVVSNATALPPEVLEAHAAQVPVAGWLGPSARFPTRLVEHASGADAVAALANAVRTCLGDSAVRARQLAAAERSVGEAAVAQHAERLAQIYRDVVAAPSPEVLRAREHLAVLLRGSAGR